VVLNFNLKNMKNRKLFFAPAIFFLLTPGVAHANMVVSAFSVFTGNILSILFATIIVTIVEFLIIKFGLKISFWKSLYSVFLANLFTSIFGWLLLRRTIDSFYLENLNLYLVFLMIVIFVGNLLMEIGVIEFFTKLQFRQILLYAFIANLVTYLGIIIIVNIPHIL